MSGTLAHSPADVIRKLLVNLALGSDANAVPAEAWPVFASGEPASPDSVITVYDTAGKNDGRAMATGERSEHYGIQVRVRSAAHTAGYAKAQAIAIAFDETVTQNAVTIGSTTYLVHAVSRRGPVLNIGKETPTSKRSLFTLNALVSLRQYV